MNRTERKALNHVWQTAYRAEIRRMYALDNGIPIPGTGKSSNLGHYRDGAGRSSGVISNSRVLPYRFKEEGNYGPTYRREIRRAERVQWLSEYYAECTCELDEMMSYDSYE